MYVGMRTVRPSTPDSFGQAQNYAADADTQVISYKYAAHRSRIGRARYEYAMCSWGISGSYAVIR